MKLVTFDVGGEPAVGILDGDVVRETQYRDMIAAIEQGGVKAGRVAGRSTEVHLHAPIPRPGAIFGSGINYRSHWTENPDAVEPTEPGFFVKLSSSVIGPGRAIELPYDGSHSDYEIELALVIGRVARRVSRCDAPDYLFGVTIINDVSERLTQFRPNQTDLGKGCDTYCPMGPCILTGDDLFGRTYELRSYVNDELRQHATTEDWIFSVGELIEHITSLVTLYPGDVVSTGTPAGCGTFRDPPRWLEPGDTVRLEIDDVGVLSNPVVRGWPSSPATVRP